MKFRIQPINDSGETHPILKLFDAVSFTEEEIGKIADCSEVLLKMVDNADLEARLGMLAGVPQSEVEVISKAYQKLKEYIVKLPEMKKEYDRKVIEEELRQKALKKATSEEK